MAEVGGTAVVAVVAMAVVLFIFLSTLSVHWGVAFVLLALVVVIVIIFVSCLRRYQVMVVLGLWLI